MTAIARSIFALLAATLALFATASAQRGEQVKFRAERLADGVYALIRNEPASFWFVPNNLLIVGERGAVVVDSNTTSELTREVIAEIRRLTDRPVLYVVNTHWHEDHIIGNRVYREEFPGVKFVAHRSTAKDLTTIGVKNRLSSLQNGRGFVGLLEGKLEKGEGIAGNVMTDEERAAYRNDIGLISAYLAESPRFEIVMPDVEADERLDLDLGGRKVEVMWLGRAHTAADLVVFLRKEGIAAVGDLITHPIPLVGSTSYPLEYGATLRKLRSLGARKLLPGHGHLMQDAKYLDAMIALLDSIKDQTEASAKRGESLEQMRKSVDLESHRKTFAGDSVHKSLIFKNYVTLPAVEAAFRQLNERKGT